MTTADREPQMGLTFEKVWAMFQETDRRMQETDRRMQETDRRMQETDRKMQETDRKIQETDRIVQEAGRIVGDLGNKFGKLAEHLVVPNILEKFNLLGYTFTRTNRNVKFLDPRKQTLTEADAILENGDFLMIVEVKSDLTEAHVKRHIDRMEKLRRYADDHGDPRKLLGAVAGAIMADQVKAYALNTGFYVIEQSGDTVKITVPRDFKPKEW
jgi:hypothetical protein